MAAAPRAASAFRASLVKMWIRAIVVTAAAAGCSSDLITSTNLVGQSGQQSGLVYALPKGQIQLNAHRKIITDDDVSRAQRAAADAAALAAIDAQALQAAKDKLENDQGALRASKPPATAELDKTVALDQAAVDYLTSKLLADRKLADAAQARAETVAQNNGQWEESATVTLQPVIPDANARYVANFMHQITRSDNFKLTVANGLLSSSTATSTDQTKEILVSLAATVALFLGVPAFPPQTLPFYMDHAEEPEKCEAYQFSRIFDPSNFREIHEVLSELSVNKPAVVVDIDGIHCEMDVTDPQSLCPLNRELSASSRPLANPMFDGLVYRVQKPVRITTGDRRAFRLPHPDTSSCEFRSVSTALSTVAVVPDSSTSFVLPAKAGPFTTATLSHNFKDGMPTEFSLGQPSELASIASLPIEMAKAIVRIPTELLQLRVNYDSEANALIAAEVEQLKARLELLQAQKQLEAARAADTTTSDFTP